MKFIIGKKLDMTQVWQGDKVVAVTRVQAGPCTVAQVKTNEKDGYSAAQVGYGERKEKNIAKPQLGHLAKTRKPSFAKATEGKHKNTKTNLRYLREFRCGDVSKLKIGDVINVSSFETGDKIQVTSTSKGKGFQGVVKRHGFHGQDKTHGNKDQLRMPGSIGATGPAHVFKGQKMPGRMGGDRVTVKGLEVVEVDQENDILLVKGAVPGARNGLVLIQGEGDVTPITPKDADSRQVEENIETRKHENKIVETQDIAPEKDKKAKEEAKTVKEEVNDNIEKVVVEADKKRKEEDKKESEK